MLWAATFVHWQKNGLSQIFHALLNFHFLSIFYTYTNTLSLSFFLFLFVCMYDLYVPVSIFLEPFSLSKHIASELPSSTVPPSPSPQRSIELYLGMGKPNRQSSSNLSEVQPRSEPTLELHSRAVSSVGVMYCLSSPNTGSNSGGGRILKKYIYNFVFSCTTIL